MSRRFTLAVPTHDLPGGFRLGGTPPPASRPFVAPSQQVMVVRRLPGQDRELAFLRWGLIPAWAEDPNVGSRLINARCESAAEKPAFREAFRHRRCLVPADGFFLWKKDGGKKEPYYLHLQGKRLFAFAGLWERWQGPAGEAVESCAILTTTANELVRRINNRMPAILDPGAYHLWLDPDVHDPDVIQPLLRPYPGADLVADPAGRRANGPTPDGPGSVPPTNQPLLF